jgi:hypothetical protein
LVPVASAGGRCQHRRPDLRRRSNRHDPSCHSNRPPRPTAKLKRKEKERKKRISITSSWHKSVSALVTKQQTHGRNQKRLALKERKKDENRKIKE